MIRDYINVVLEDLPCSIRGFVLRSDDYYTIVGKRFKYSIPFSIFEVYNRKMGELLKEVKDKDTMLDFLIEGVGFSAFYNRTKYRVIM